MTSAEIQLVQASWATTRDRARFFELVNRLTGLLGDHPGRAAWLLVTTDELVRLLDAPSALGDRARELATGLHADATEPSFDHDGTALLTAMRATNPDWDDAVERAWLRAWHLLAEELALDRLSPFAGPTPDPSSTATNPEGAMP